MATPLTDSINALTAYANEVTGGSDTNLSDAVHTLASGYGGGENYLKGAKCLYHLFDGATFPETLVLDFEGASLTRTAEYFIANVTGVKYLTIKNLVWSNVSMQYSFNNSSMETITFDNCVLQPVRVNRAFGSSYLKSVIGEIDLSLCTNDNDMLYFSRALENIRFKKDTIGTNFTLIGTSKLSDETLVSIANALNDSVSQKVTGKNYAPRIETILGDNDNGTFVINQNGTLLLGDFITSVKGWTITT